MKRLSGDADGPAFGTGKRVLAAQVAAVGRQPQAAAMDDAVQRAVAVMHHVEPLRAVIVGAVDHDVAGAILQRAVVGDLARVGVVDHRRRMRRRVAHEMPPVARRAGIGAAIDDQSLVRGTHLEAERAGMGDAVHAAAGRAAGIGDHQRGAGGEPLEAARQRHGRRALARARPRQHQVDQRAIGLPGAVEQGEPAVAVTEEAQQRRHAVDGGDDLGRRAALGRAEGRTHVDQMAQHRELQVRRALGHDAVVQHVALHEPGEPRQRLLEALLEVLAVAQEGEVDEDQRLEARRPPRARPGRCAARAGDGCAGGRARTRSGRGSPDRRRWPASRSDGSTRRCARPAPRASR